MTGAPLGGGLAQHLLGMPARGLRDLRPAQHPGDLLDPSRGIPLRKRASELPSARYRAGLDTHIALRVEVEQPVGLRRGGRHQ